MSVSRRQFLKSSTVTAAAVPLGIMTGIDYCEAAPKSPVDLSMGFPPGAVRLNYNENTLGPSPKALEGAIAGRALYDGRLEPAEALAVLAAASRGDQDPC